jgi:hypothetical protein
MCELSVVVVPFEVAGTLPVGYVRPCCAVTQTPNS